MLKNSFDIVIYFSFQRTQVSEISENKDIPNYVMNRIWWNWNKLNIDNIFAYNIALNIINDIEDQEKFISVCWQRNGWPKWKDIIEVEFDSLVKWKDFGPVFHTLECVKPVRYKWIFVQKQNENGEIMIFKVWLDA